MLCVPAICHVISKEILIPCTASIAQSRRMLHFKFLLIYYKQTTTSVRALFARCKFSIVFIPVTDLVVVTQMNYYYYYYYYYYY